MAGDNFDLSGLTSMAGCNARDLMSQIGQKSAVPTDVIEGIQLMFTIIDSEVGDRMDYLDQKAKDRIEAVSKWLEEVRK